MFYCGATSQQLHHGRERGRLCGRVKRGASCDAVKDESGGGAGRTASVDRAVEVVPMSYNLPPE